MVLVPTGWVGSLPVCVGVNIDQLGLLMNNTHADQRITLPRLCSNCLCSTIACLDHRGHPMETWREKHVGYIRRSLCSIIVKFVGSFGAKITVGC